MASLYKRATPQQHRILRIVEGAVKNAADAHGLEWPHNFARSIAKRAAGTLTARWRDVLAAKLCSPSESAVPSPTARGRARGAQIGKPLGGARRVNGSRSPLDKIWKELSKQCGAAKRADNQERLQTLIEVLKLVDAAQKRLARAA